MKRESNAEAASRLKSEILIYACPLKYTQGKYMEDVSNEGIPIRALLLQAAVTATINDKTIAG